MVAFWVIPYVSLGAVMATGFPTTQNDDAREEVAFARKSASRANAAYSHVPLLLSSVG